MILICDYLIKTQGLSFQ